MSSGQGSGAEAHALQGSGLVRQLAERWQAALQGDKQALMSSGQELPPLSAISKGALNSKNLKGVAAKAGISPHLLQSIMQEDDSKEELEEFSMEVRRPGGGRHEDGEDGAEDPRRTSLIQYVHARFKIRGELRIVVKVLHPSPEVAKVLDVMAMSQKEAGLYKHVLPNMASLWEKQSFDVFPKCYHSSADILVLEDLRAKGFAPANMEASAGLSAAHCAAALRGLARFHAASLAYKRAGVAEAGAVLAQAGLESVYTSGRRPALEHLLAKAAKNTVELLKRHPEASKHCSKVQELLSNRFDRLVELHRPREPMAVLTHGDPRANNMLFRRSPEALENAEDPYSELEVRLLDLRACRYGSPALDLSRLLWGGGADAGARAEIDVLIRIYYRALGKALKGAHGSPSPPFSLAELRKEVESYAVYGLLTADLSLRLQLNAPGRDMVAEAGGTERAVEDFLASNAPGDAFARAFGDIVLDLADKGLLK